MNMLRFGITVSVLIANISLVPVVGATGSQSDTGETSKFIVDVFRSTTGNIPHLGWVLPEGTVVTTLDASEVFVLSGEPQVVKAPRKSTAYPRDSLRFIKRHHVACDVPTGGTPVQLSLYS